MNLEVFRFKELKTKKGTNHRCIIKRICKILVYRDYDLNVVIDVILREVLTLNSEISFIYDQDLS